MDAAPSTVDAVAQELYGIHPDRFVAARDDAVAAARAAGDRDLARAVGRLRRPTRAAWLANLLARERAEQLDGLLGLAGDLAQAQRTLDGNALRALSAQRRRLVAAMAREGGRLAAQAGDGAAESVMRDLEGILDAALADPAMAAELRSGRLTHTVRYSGFGPAGDLAGGAGAVGAGTSTGLVGSRDTVGADRDAHGGHAGDEASEREPTAGGESPGREPTAGAEAERAEAERGKADRAEEERRERERADHARRTRERLEREHAERTRLVAEAEGAEAAAHDRAQACEADHRDAEATRADARARVADLVADLEAAREHERAAAAAVRDASAVAKESARAEGAAATRADRARARLAELSP